jgi:hypothetical protein
LQKAVRPGHDLRCVLADRFREISPPRAAPIQTFYGAHGHSYESSGMNKIAPVGMYMGAA